MDQSESKLIAMAKFIAASVLSGLLVAGLVVPFAALFGVGATAAAKAMHNLPDDFETPAQFEGSKVYLADGSLLAAFAEQDRKYVTLDQISPLMRKAQIAIEDHRFYEHGALDFKGFMRALIKGGGGQGGSSLTQQYVKQVQIQIAIDNGDKEAEAKAQERTISRKVQELRRAVAVEQKLTKDQILERYLNIAYYGDGSYGVESAAQHYFGVPAKDLTLPQAALIAGMVQNPSATDPIYHPKAAIERRNQVLDRMADHDVSEVLAKIEPTSLVVTRAQAEEAKAVPFDQTKVKPRENGCAASRYPFVCDYALNELKHTASLRGASGDEATASQNAMNILNRKGLSIVVSVDPRFQDAAQAQLDSILTPTDPVIGIMSSIEPGTGRIIMMAQSRPVMGTDAGKGETFWNYNAGDNEGYQPGSTFKTFAMAAALDKGIPMTKTYDNYSGMELGGAWDLCNGQTGVVESYKPVNFMDFKGRADMKKAASESVNSYFLQLARDAGLCNTAKMADAAGIRLTSGQTVADFAAKDAPVPSAVLGSVEIQPLSLTTAFATYGARGNYCPPRLVDKITRGDGTEFAINPNGCKQTIKPEVMDALNNVLNSNVKSYNYSYLWNHIPVNGANPAYDMGAKTGTTDGTQTALMMSYTPDLSTQVLFTTDKQHPFFAGKSKEQIDITKAPLAKGGIRDAHGTIQPLVGRYWHDVLPLTKGTKFVAPKDEYVTGKDITVPSLPGKDIAADEKALNNAGLSTQRVTINNSSPAGTYLGYSPGGGQKVKGGTTIQLYVSSGQVPTQTPKPTTTSSSAPPPATSTTTAPPPATTSKPANPGNPTQPKKT